MRRVKCLHCLVLCLSLSGPALLFAKDPVVTIDGEAFSKTFTAGSPSGDRLIELVREGESFGNWTKLVGFRYQQLPRIDNDPIKFAGVMAQLVKSSNPQAQSRVIVNKDETEAIVDFITWQPNAGYAEFNVFRCVRSKGGNAVVSLQFAHRLTDASAEGIEKFKRLRESWVSQAAAFDMNVVHSAFAQ
ncbi:MAG TPA: hypothetical protein VFV71_08655 [Burkholderiales bacterium]|nr:hypothetical protein [Burkholderiales bacterium]